MLRPVGATYTSVKADLRPWTPSLEFRALRVPRIPFVKEHFVVIGCDVAI